MSAIGLLARGLKALAHSGLLHTRVIYDHRPEGTEPYLTRYYIMGAPHMADGSSPYNETGNPKPEAIFPEGMSVVIHHFHKSDEDRELHNHPWRWAISLILENGYREERMVISSMKKECADPIPLKREVETFDYLAGDINVLTSETFHRVKLLPGVEGGEVWSLFFIGPRNHKSWGYWDRAHDTFLHWRVFMDRLRGKRGVS